MSSATGSRPASWGFGEGDPITPELTAIRLLGGGTSYEALLAFDELTYGPVVVKVLRPDQVADATSVRGLRREAEALAAVNHPVVVRGLRHEDGGERPHLVLEQVDGPRLSSLIRRYGPLQPQQYLPLGIEVAGALHYLRHIGWTHLDIKPSNTIMGAPARLIDFSVARPVEQAAALEFPVGTDAYMPPEQADPTNHGWAPGFASDVYGLCATLFHAVAGYRPFPEGDPDSRPLEERFPQLVTHPAALPEGTPAEVEKVILAGLELHPEDRPLPGEIADQLMPVLERQPRMQFAGFKTR